MNRRACLHAHDSCTNSPSEVLVRCSHPCNMGQPFVTGCSRHTGPLSADCQASAGALNIWWAAAGFNPDADGNPLVVQSDKHACIRQRLLPHKQSIGLVTGHMEGNERLSPVRQHALLQLLNAAAARGSGWVSTQSACLFTPTRAMWLAGGVGCSATACCTDLLPASR
jgi:hypothetical protein